jgi:hypothetical protein
LVNDANSTIYVAFQPKLHRYIARLERLSSRRFRKTFDIQGVA